MSGPPLRPLGRATERARGVRAAGGPVFFVCNRLRRRGLLGPVAQQPRLFRQQPRQCRHLVGGRAIVTQRLLREPRQRASCGRGRGDSGDRSEIEARSRCRRGADLPGLGGAVPLLDQAKVLELLLSLLGLLLRLGPRRRRARTAPTAPITTITAFTAAASLFGRPFLVEGTPLDERLEPPLPLLLLQLRARARKRGAESGTMGTARGARRQAAWRAGKGRCARGVGRTCAAAASAC